MFSNSLIDAAVLAFFAIWFGVQAIVKWKEKKYGWFIFDVVFSILDVILVIIYLCK